MSEAGRLSAVDAFTAAYLGNYRMLVRLAALLVDDIPSCEDVVQEAYVRAYSGAARLRDPEQALAYLRQTVVNLSRSTLRRRATARLAALDPPRVEPSAEQQVFAAVARADVVRALRALPRRQREVLALRYYAELTVAQTAAALGLSMGSVKSYASRGLDELAARLEEAQ